MSSVDYPETMFHLDFGHPDQIVIRNRYKIKFFKRWWLLSISFEKV